MVKNYLKNKKGIIIGSTIAILLLCYHSIPFSLQDIQKRWLNVLGLLMTLNLILGGAISGFIVENCFIHKLTKKGSIIGCITGSVLISPLSFYSSAVMGCILVGDWIPFFVSKIGMGKSGSILVLFIGIILVIIIVESIGAMIGTALGFLGENLVRQLPFFKKDNKVS